MALELRDAVAADAPAICDLLADGLGYSRQALAHVHARLADGKRFPNLYTIVAVADTRVVGVASFVTLHLLDHDKPQARISAIAISDADRRTGVATELVAEIERRAAALGCFRVELTSSHALPEAHEFWEATGYTNAGVRFVRYL